MVTYDDDRPRPGQRPFGLRRAITVRLPDEHYETLQDQVRRQGYQTANAYVVALLAECLDLDAPEWAAPAPPAWTHDDPQGRLALYEVSRRSGHTPGHLRPVTVRLPESHYETLRDQAQRQGYPTTNAFAVTLLSMCLDLDAPEWARPSRPARENDDDQGLLALGA